MHSALTREKPARVRMHPPISNNVACPSLVKGTPLGTECEQHGAVCRGFESHRGDQFQKSKSSAEEYGYFTYKRKTHRVRLLPRICHVRRPVIRLPAKHGDSLFDSDTWLQFSNLNRVLNVTVTSFGENTPLQFVTSNIRAQQVVVAG